MTRPRHRSTTRRARFTRRLAALVVLLGALVAVFPQPSALATSYTTVSGSGDSWSQVAIDTWRVDVAANGINVNFNGDGATAGRLDYIQGLSDFAVSPIPFQTHPTDGSPPEDASGRPYAYMPIVAGGTAFMYHLTVGGHLVTNLRLSGETLTKIFTGVITNWDDPAITHDYGAQLPSEPITPVVRADGSGTSAEFTEYMATEYPSLWNAFCVKYAAATPPCGMYSFYPTFPGSKAQTGSNGVADYVASSYANGSITYVEYAYALDLNYPVVQMLNAANYYTLPTASNVAVALTKAQINPDLTQNLTNVYTNPDPRTYPLSSYDYFIIPTTTASPFNTAKGVTLSTFADYFLCTGQQQAPELGYSPLPENLVQAAFTQVQRIPGNVGTPPISSCKNPTFVNGVNTLLKDGPYPTACEKAGAPLNCTVSSGHAVAATSTGATSATTSTTATTGIATTAPTTHTTGTQQSGGAATTKTGATTTTGTAAGTAQGTAAKGTSGAADVSTADPPGLDSAIAPAARTSGVLYIVIAGELVAVLATPPLIVAALRRRRRART